MDSKKITTINALEQRAFKFKLGQNFLLVGTDSFLIDSLVNQIKQEICAANKIDTIIVYADDVQAGELAEHLDTFTIFSSNKLVLLRNAEQLKKKQLEVVSAYFDSPAENQSLIIVSDKIDAHLATWKKIGTASLRINCYPPKWGSEVRTWLVAELRKMGKSMRPKAIEEFCSRIELDYSSAFNELTKINLLTHNQNTITEEDVLVSLGTTRTGTLIDFYRALGKRNHKASLQAVELMLDSDWEHLQVFFQLYKFYSVLFKIQLLRRSHVSDSEISAKHIPEVYLTQRKEYLEFAKAYNLNALESIMEILLDTDRKLKSSNIDKTLQLGLAIMAVLEA
ncbi:MAG: DNA polymerase III subunit delta [Candidatus Cloacimonetes bacterium]|jgi:DNA polymerase-3 subunit delta|nr:DNA polymerase III subunit delta [Candidatus Cloacimonadota bacterium]